MLTSSGTSCETKHLQLAYRAKKIHNKWSKQHQNVLWSQEMQAAVLICSVWSLLKLMWLLRLNRQDTIKCELNILEILIILAVSVLSRPLWLSLWLQVLWYERRNLRPEVQQLSDLLLRQHEQQRPLLCRSGPAEGLHQEADVSLASFFQQRDKDEAKTQKM